MMQKTASDSLDISAVMLKKASQHPWGEDIWSLAGLVPGLSQSELSEKQCMTTNYDMLGRFCKLASEAGKIVGSMDNIILPISKTELWVKDPEEYWLLLLHRLCLPQHDLWFVPEDENTPNLTLSMRQARENEPYIAVLDNVFLSSAMACGRLAASGEADLADEKLAERGQNIINIEKFNGVLGDVQAENVQTGDHSSIHKPPVTEKKEKGIFRKLLKIIGIVIVAIIAAIVVDILGDLGWLESIKNLILQLK